MNTKPHISGGVYLVIDPAMERALLLAKLSEALKAGLQAVQIWNNWPQGIHKLAYIASVAALCRAYGIPLLINQEWELLLETNDIDGVHFDTLPPDYTKIRASVNRPFIAGITCSGDLNTIAVAEAQGLDYVSFCAMFPSPSAGSCAIVTQETVQEARSLTNMPLFVSGGMTPENVSLLKQRVMFDGVAVISGILSAPNPGVQVKRYHESLSILNK